jgi:branched-chain amino acid transport system permease protein
MNTKAFRVSSILFALVVVLLALPSMVKVPYYLHLTVLALIWVVVAQGQNLIQGYTGYVSIAQGGFMGIGAYGSALLSVKLGWSVWLTLSLSPILTGIFAILVGYPSLRVKGHYFAIVTLAFNMVIYIVLFNFRTLTGGEAGFTDIPRPGDFSVGAFSFSSLAGYYYLVVAAAITATAFCWLLVHSRVGRNLIAIRQNEALADAIGIATWRYKLFAFVVSASLAGFAGGLYAHFIRFINPDTFTVAQSLNAILAVILGGSGTLAGPIVGSFVVVFLPEYLRIADFFRLIVYGFILILATIFMPRGIVSVVGRLGRAAQRYFK